MFEPSLGGNKGRLCGTGDTDLKPNGLRGLKRPDSGGCQLADILNRHDKINTHCQVINSIKTNKFILRILKK